MKMSCHLHKSGAENRLGPGILQWTSRLRNGKNGHPKTKKLCRECTVPRSRSKERPRTSLVFRRCSSSHQEFRSQRQTTRPEPCPCPTISSLPPPSTFCRRWSELLACPAWEGEPERIQHAIALAVWFRLGRRVHDQNLRKMMTSNTLDLSNLLSERGCWLTIV